MGCKLFKPSKTKNSSIDPFYYLDRKRQRLLYIHQDKIIASQFLSSIIFPPDSAVCYLNESCILVAGGTDGSSFSTNFILINALRMKIKFLASLPVGVKEGSLYIYENWVYYVGGVSHAILDSRSVQEEAAPLMRFDLEKNRWEYFVGPDIQEFMKRKMQNIGENDEEFDPSENNLYKFDLDQFTLRDLFLPGTFMSNHKIYFIGGYIMDNIGKLIPNSQIFSLNLRGDKLRLAVEPFTAPFNVIKPICSSGNQHIIITGGFDPNTEQPSPLNFTLSLNKSYIKFTPLDVLPINLLESCCPIYKNDTIIFPNFPIVPIRRKLKKNWEIFDAGKNKKHNFMVTADLIKCVNKKGENDNPPIRRIRRMAIPIGVFKSKEEGFEFLKKMDESKSMIADDEINIDIDEVETNCREESSPTNNSKQAESFSICNKSTPINEKNLLITNVEGQPKKIVIKSKEKEKYHSAHKNFIIYE
ncbi:unnamed protein product [Blepharisma stoltei]|uniref:Kelch motif family protein n=1 Tax=Blepharisma stoltei TaxID=1481888 RepID=A0AAU9JMC8_9CILI|nr:unnamed protein product [Blepharisma stoltei]